MSNIGHSGSKRAKFFIALALFINIYLDTYFVRLPHATIYHVETIVNEIQTTPKNNNSSNENNIEKIRVTPLKPDKIIRALLYFPCSGSSALYAHSRDILIAHGLNVEYFTIGELDKLKNSTEDKFARENALLHNKNATDNDILYEKMKILNEKSASTNQVLFTKAFYSSAFAMRKLDSAFAGLLRYNSLDRAMCFVNDCFNYNDAALGYPEFENGTVSDLCFKRRTYKDFKTKIHFDVERLETFIQNDVKQIEMIFKKYSYFTRPGKIQYAEDLYAFEYVSNETVFQESVDAWASLLKSFVPKIDKDIVKNILLPLKNSRKSPAPHRESIVNFYRVKKALKQLNLDYFIRE